MEYDDDDEYCCMIDIHSTTMLVLDILANLVNTCYIKLELKC